MRATKRRVVASGRRSMRAESHASSSRSSMVMHRRAGFAAVRLFVARRKMFFRAARNRRNGEMRYDELRPPRPSLRLSAEAQSAKVEAQSKQSRDTYAAHD